MAVIEATVEFDYTAQEPDELSLKKGDLITAIRTQSGGWWEGTLVRENRRGMFPDNFVRVLGGAAADSSVVMRKKPGRKCKVLFSYSPANADELELHVDDVIDVLSEVEEGWWRGRLRNRTGVFPSNFVEEIEVEEKKENNNNEEGVKSAATVVREQCKVLFPYDAQNEDELSLKEEDIVSLISREAPDKGWWKGELNGRTGLFPDNFVTVLPSTEEPCIKSEKPSSASKSTTNRARDSITKPGETTTAALRKSLDLSNKKEETPPVIVSPAGVKQKPAPPMKKPSRSPPAHVAPKPIPSHITVGSNSTTTASNITLGTNSSTASSITPPSPKHAMKFSLPIPPPPVDNPNTTVLPVSDNTSSNNNNKTHISIPATNAIPDVPSGDTYDGSCVSKSGCYSVTNVNCSSISAIVNNHHDSIQANLISTRRGSTSDSERRASAGAAVGSGGVTTAVSPGGQISASISGGACQSSDSELEERPVTGAKLTHLTANRARAPRRRPPSTIISREDRQQLTSLMNGSADAHIVEKVVNKISPTPAVPWVEELKMNQAKKNSAAQGKTRVTIGPFNSTTTSSTSGECAPTSKPNVGVMFRSQRPASMFAAEPPSQPPPNAAPGLVRNNSTATCNKPPSTGASTSPPSATRPPSLPSAIGPSVKPPPLTTPTNEVMSVTQKQWSDLVVKMNKLESVIEAQSALISELSLKVKLGQDKQLAMQNEMDKLMELVTQV